MEVDETVLSDVHLYTDNCSDDEGDSKINGDGIKFVVSRLKFNEFELNGDEKEPAVDEDGDFELIRPKINFISIQHALSTQLNDVGLQVWNGSLLLSDFILHNSEKWKNENILELGSGTGLCSVLLAMYAKTVLCTDTGDGVLGLCAQNVSRNDKLMGTDGKILVRELNWLNENPINGDCGPWSWKPDDMKVLQTVFYIFASDVIYDDELTDAFFDVVEKLMKEKCYCLFVSLEKRLNFTLTTLEIAAPAYDHFKKRLKTLKTNGNSVTKLQTDFPQHFTYDRTKYLEIWQICACVCTKCINKFVKN